MKPGLLHAHLVSSCIITGWPIGLFTPLLSAAAVSSVWEHSSANVTYSWSCVCSSIWLCFYVPHPHSCLDTVKEPPAVFMWADPHPCWHEEGAECSRLSQKSQCRNIATDTLLASRSFKVAPCSHNKSSLFSLLCSSNSKVDNNRNWVYNNTF